VLGCYRVDVWYREKGRLMCGIGGKGVDVWYREKGKGDVWYGRVMGGIGGKRGWRGGGREERE
jgi:hypothetical protein